MPSNKQVLNVRYDEETYQKLKYISQALNRSMSNLVEYWSKLSIADYEAKQGSISLETETIAAHRLDNPMDDMPQEAWDSIQAFKKSYKDEMKKRDKK